MTIQLEGAKITEQGVTFAIIVVRPHVIHCARDQAPIETLGLHTFGPIPIVLMAQDSRGVPTYFGRPDLVRFLSGVVLDQIPWQRYTLSAA